MHRTTRPILLAFGMAISFAAVPAAAQHPQVRHGFWFNAGLAYGSLGCSDCGDRLGGASATISASAPTSA